MGRSGSSVAGSYVKVGSDDGLSRIFTNEATFLQHQGLVFLAAEHSLNRSGPSRGLNGIEDGDGIEGKVEEGKC